MTAIKQSKSLFQHAIIKILTDKLSLIALIVVGIYFAVALLTSVGLLAGDWSKEIGPSYAAPSLDYIFGTDIFGRSVFLKMIKGVETAVAIGFVTSIISVII